MNQRLVVWCLRCRGAPHRLELEMPPKASAGCEDKGLRVWDSSVAQASRREPFWARFCSPSAHSHHRLGRRLDWNNFLSWCQQGHLQDRHRKHQRTGDGLFFSCSTNACKHPGYIKMVTSYRHPGVHLNNKLDRTHCGLKEARACLRFIPWWSSKD